MTCVNMMNKKLDAERINFERLSFVATAVNQIDNINSSLFLFINYRLSNKIGQKSMHVKETK